MKIPLLALSAWAGFVLVACQDPIAPAPVDKTVHQSLNSSSAWATDGASSWASSPVDAHIGEVRTVNIKLSLDSPTNVSYLLSSLKTTGSAVNISSVDPSLRSLVSEPLAVASKPNRFTRLELPHQGPLPFRTRDPSGRSARPGTPRGAEASSPPAVGDAFTYNDFWNEGTIGTHRQFRRTVGSRTLSVWVADDCWSTDGTTAAYVKPALDPSISWVPPEHLVTLNMVAALADRFLVDGSNNDVYDWVTGIFGNEWTDAGTTPMGFDNLIDGQAEIHIFLMNLNPNGTDNGTLMGYFWGGNNYLVSSMAGSNQKILFALDADSLANPDDRDDATTDTWDLGKYWPAELVSTLAHEFQHMIHFYQKQVLRGAEETETWIDEMASMVTEDLVADKLGNPGPRGRDTYSAGTEVDNRGRLSEYNGNHDSTSLTRWDYDFPLANYAQSYAFGAWLLRNYGGPDLFRRLVQSQGANYLAVVDAVHGSTNGAGQTYSSLVRDWGVATYLASNSTIDGFRFAAPSTPFSWDLDGETYRVGDIDLKTYKQWIYTPTGSGFEGLVGPRAHSSLSSTSKVAPGATYVLKAGKKSGTFKASLVLPKNVQLTVVLTP